MLLKQAVFLLFTVNLQKDATEEQIVLIRPMSLAAHVKMLSSHVIASQRGHALHSMVASKKMTL